MGDFSAPMNFPPAVNPAPPRATAFREDCWTEEATATLVDAWGRRFLEQNRGNLRVDDWNGVAFDVNQRHGSKEKTRTDVQCKNRIDTVKKRFKAEKARVQASGGAYVSSWRFFDQLDFLIGQDKVEASRKTPPGGSGWRGEAFPPRGTRSGIGGGFGTGSGTRTPPMAIALRREATELPEAVAVAPLRRSGGVDDSFFRRNYSAMAAAAAKEEAYDEEDESEEEQSEEEKRYEKRRGKEVAVGVEERRGAEPEMINGTRMIAMAINRFAEKYEKVEMEKLRQLKEVEVRRIDAGKDVELKRLELLMDTRVQFEKLKRKEAKKKSSGLDDICSS